MMCLKLGADNTWKGKMCGHVSIHVLQCVCIDCPVT
jgi:hypothetical protein